MRYKRRLFYLIIPFVLVTTLMGATGTTTYKSVDKRQPTLRDWLKENDQIVTIGMTLALPIAGWLFMEWRKAKQQEQEAGRREFLALATTTITESISEKLVAKLDLLEDKLEWVYKEINQFERQLHETDNELSQLRVGVTNLSADVKLLRAARKEFLNRLNDQLAAAEEQINHILNEYCAGKKCDLYQSRLSQQIKDPFDSNGEGTLY